MPEGKHNIVIVFWPQILEYFGMIFGAGDVCSASEAKVRAKIGVREKNRWGVSLCEPVRLPTGAYGTFVRFIPWGQLNEGTAGMVIIPATQDGKLVFIKTFRTGIRSWMLELPRATRDAGVDKHLAIKNELREETGVDILTKPKLIGHITADSGVLTTKVEVYFVKVRKVTKPTPHVTEAISGIVTLSEKDIKKVIKKGAYIEVAFGKKEKDRVYEFSDGFSLAALTLARVKGIIE